MSPEDIKAWNAAAGDWHATRASVDLRQGGAFSSRMEARDGSEGFDFAGTCGRSMSDKPWFAVFRDGPGGVRVGFDPGHHPEDHRRAAGRQPANTWQASAGKRQVTRSPARMSGRSRGCRITIGLPERSMCSSVSQPRRSTT